MEGMIIGEKYCKKQKPKRKTTTIKIFKVSGIK